MPVELSEQAVETFRRCEHVDELLRPAVPQLHDFLNFGTCFLQYFTTGFEEVRVDTPALLTGVLELMLRHCP